MVKLSSRGRAQPTSIAMNYRKFSSKSAKKSSDVMLDKESQEEPIKLRQIFPETWLWHESVTGYKFDTNIIVDIT